MKFDYVGTDTETTGLNSKVDEILSVTVAEFNLSGEVGKKMTIMCRPMSGHIPPEASRVNGITMDMVKDCPNYLRDGVREEVAKFIGTRTLVGHNLVGFDSKFLKIKAKRMEDTLLICRTKYRGGNKLKTACQRVGIKWDDAEAHSSEYDTLKCIELFVKIKEIERKESDMDKEAPLFAQAAAGKDAIEADPVKAASEFMEVTRLSKDDLRKMGVIPSEQDKDLVATQAYSYSRIKLFHQCPFKWYMQYVKKIQEPEVDYLLVGKICHKAAEWAGEWCYRELFANKFVKYFEAKKMSISVETAKGLATKYSKKSSEVTVRDFALYLYDNPAAIREFVPGASGLAALVHEMDQVVDPESYEKPSMPDAMSYEDIVQRAIARFKCSDAKVIRDVKSVMGRFMKLKDFSLTPGDITIMEKRLAFDRDWQPLKDFFANNVFFRGVIDVLDYFGEYVVITDYKTSRKMMSDRELLEDMQMLTYVLLVYLFLPKDSYQKLVVRVEYIRYGITLEYEITDVKAAADRAFAWIKESIQQVEKELLKTDGSAFAPKRNEYCHTCHIGEDGKCPLFNKQMINDIGDPFQFTVSDIEDCQNAWKRVEANKAENSRLAKQCKAFAKQCESEIRIDENAILDFWTDQTREFNAKATLTLLLKKKIPIEKILHYFSLPPTAGTELIETELPDITEEELNSISRVKNSTKFEAFTREEAESKGYLNA